MTLLAERSEMLATVLRSPAAVATHDRTAWLDLFTDDGVVVDPVGSRPHSGRIALGKFYDTFIGPRDITFTVDADIVSGSSVFRNVTLGVAMAESVRVEVPAILRYDLSVVDDTLRVARLRAYWELPPMIAALARTGLAAGPVGVALSASMLRNQGVTGTFGFLLAFRRPGRGSVDAVRDFLDAAARADHEGANGLIAAGAAATVNNAHVDPTVDLVAALHDARSHKFLAAGTTVAAALDHAAWTGFIFVEFTSGTASSISVVTEPK